MATGSVTRLVRDRVFGLIRPPDGSEISFHASTLPMGVFDTLQAGQEVEFEAEADPRGCGQRPRNVELIA
jgi:cold shock CspA family protein